MRRHPQWAARAGPSSGSLWKISAQRNAVGSLQHHTPDQQCDQTDRLLMPFRPAATVYFRNDVAAHAVAATAVHTVWRKGTGQERRGAGCPTCDVAGAAAARQRHPGLVRPPPRPCVQPEPPARSALRGSLSAGRPHPPLSPSRRRCRRGIPTSNVNLVCSAPPTV